MSSIAILRDALLKYQMDLIEKISNRAQEKFGQPAYSSSVHEFDGETHYYVTIPKGMTIEPIEITDDPALQGLIRQQHLVEDLKDTLGYED